MNLSSFATRHKDLIDAGSKIVQAISVLIGVGFAIYKFHDDGMASSYEGHQFLQKLYAESYETRKATEVLNYGIYKELNQQNGMSEYYDKQLREVEPANESIYRQLNYCVKFGRCSREAALDLFCSSAREFAYAMNTTVRTKLDQDTGNLIRTRPPIEVYAFYAECAKLYDESFLERYKKAFPRGQGNAANPPR